MKEAVNVIMTIVQMVIGVLILVGAADIRTVAWYWVISGAVVIVLLVVAGLAMLAIGKKVV